MVTDRKQFSNGVHGLLEESAIIYLHKTCSSLVGVNPKSNRSRVSNELLKRIR